MSEYQHYEFLAVDRALDAHQLDELRALSTRAHITPTSFVNTYHWGNFRGDPHKMMERYFDAFLYLANWGTRQLMIRLPARLLDLATAQRYCGTDSATAWAKDGNVIIDLTRHDEDGDWDDEDGEGRLRSSALAPTSPPATCACCTWHGCIRPTSANSTTTKSNHPCRRTWPH